MSNLVTNLMTWLSPNDDTSGDVAVDNKDPKKLSCTGKANEYHDLDDENKVNDDDNDDEDDDGNDDDDDGEDSASSSDDDESDDDDDDDDDEIDDNNRPPNNDGLSNYERLRLERIQRNQERLQQLGLQQFNIAPTDKIKKKKQKKKKVSIIGDARSQPKRSVKKKLQHGELLEGGLNVPKMRLSLGLTTPSGKKMKIKTNKHMYSKRCKLFVLFTV